MKLAIFLLTAALFQAHGNVLAQKVTISGKEITLKQVFEAIEKQTDYLVFSNESFLDKTKPVSISVYQVTVQELLDLALKGQPVQYAIKNKTIFLSPKLIAPPSMAMSDLLQTGKPILQITGILRTVEGELLAGVSVRVKQNSNGTISDSKGYFLLKTDETDPVLILSMIGYETMEVILKKTETGYDIVKSSGGIAVANLNQIGVINFEIAMKKAVSILDEAQVIAYGQTSRRLSTGSIGTIKGEDIAKQPVMSVLEAIKGRVPGLSISPYSGNPSAPVRVIIRGRNSINDNALTDPLYVIDGIPMNNLNVSPIYKNSPVSTGAVQAGYSLNGGENPLIGINPADIESISVLKDANATAIYGSRGANGVILITTKKGKAGPTDLSIGISNGLSTVQRFPKMLNTQEYLAIRREAFRTDGIVPTESDAPDLLVWDPNKFTDWQRVFAGTGSNTTINAAVGGGSAQSNYRLSASFTTIKNPMNNGGKDERITVSGDFSNASKNNKFKFNISNSLSFMEALTYDVGSINALSPNAPDIYNSKGEFNFEPYRVLGLNRFPFATLKMPNASNSISMTSKISVSYEIMKGFGISANGGYGVSLNDISYLIPQASQDPIFGGISSAFYGKSNARNKFLQTGLNYSTFIGKGNFSVTLAANMQQMISSGETITAAMFPNDDMMKSHNNASFVTTTEGIQHYKNISALGDIKYTWENKYVINFTGRRDGSSKFGPGKKFGNFGAVGLAWVASDEKWLNNLLPSWFNMLKFDASYGETGSDGAIRNYEYLSRWSKSVSRDNASPLLSYNGINAFHVISPLNQQFQWASTRSLNAGMIMELLNNKLTIVLSVFRNRTSNQLTNAAVPMMTGFASAVTNWPANVQNSGLELSINTNLMRTKDWNIDLDFNIGMHRNKLLDFPNLENSPYAGQLRRGYSTNSKFLLKYTGINPVTGNYSFEDHNKDGVIYTGSYSFPVTDRDDRYIFLDMNDNYAGGIGLKLSYKFIRLTSQCSFVKRYRNDPYLGSTVGQMINISLPDDIQNNHWTQPGDQAKYPRYTTIGNLGPINISDANYVNGSYLRMESLSIFCQLPQKWISRIKMKGASIGISTNNLFTISPYKGLEPEVLYGVSPAPIPRYIATQLSLSF